MGHCPGPNDVFMTAANDDSPELDSTQEPHDQDDASVKSQMNRVLHAAFLLRLDA